MVCSLVSIYFDSPQHDMHAIKFKLYKTLDYWSRDMFNVGVLEKGQGIVPSYFVNDFARKVFIIFC